MSTSRGINGANGAQNQSSAVDPTPSRRKRLDLASLDDVRKEMCRTYRAMKLKKIPTQDGTRLTYVLQAIAKVIEGSDLANRIESLERALAAQKH